MIEKTTFSEVCKILKGEKTDIYDCANKVFEIALFFLPVMVCKDTSFIMNIANGATILGAKPIIETAVKNIVDTFTNRKYTDFSTKYEHAQIAQVLIVFAAYFDSMKLYLPDEERQINISPEEKKTLTEESIAQYIDYLKENSTKDADQTAEEIFNYDLTMPDPVVKPQDYLEQLQVFYNILNKEFLHFYEMLSFLDSMEESEREIFLMKVRELPAKAVENYKKQYYQLAVNFNDFFVWANIQEHRQIQESIDIGFSRISKLISGYYENSRDSKAKTTLEQYNKKYSGYIDEPLAGVSEMKLYTINRLVFPSKRQSFIPQSFRTLTYRESMHLEDKSAWKACEEQENIGKFVGDVLRHSVVGTRPLLILGHPGAGKSLLCSMLAAQILHHEYHVIIVKLRDTVAEQTVPQQINQQIERDFSNGCLWSDIASCGLEKPILIIFDGYDELLQASGKAYSDFLQRIEEFQKQQKTIYGIFVKCIVTSRITLIDKAMIPDRTPVIMLSDFDENRVRQWCQIWNESNKEYFLQTKLEKFEIDASHKVSELSKQPLLLLMLALYDSNDNALRKNKDLDMTQLYNSLIREFISRERRKDDSFRSRQKKEQKRIIDEEMLKISIAALGMYNRKILYIRANDLENDLQFLTEEKTPDSGLEEQELFESDKLLGSFFFIHKSNSTGVVDRNKVSNIAYEFLHNTFGEFLTANYIVNELKSILSWIHTLVETNKRNQWELGKQKAWVACMAYAPLFSRPVVLQMIHEWAPSYFADKNPDQIKEDLDDLVDIEIKNIISGDIIFDLKSVMQEKNNPFCHDKFLKHLAIYSLNLLTLRTVVLHDRYEFKYGHEMWSQLTYIGRYAFSEDELLSFSNLFSMNIVDDKYEIFYNCEIKKLPQNQMDKYLHISSALGDSIQYGITSALVGGGNKDKTLSLIEINQLNIRARYLWNYCLAYLQYPGYEQENLLSIVLQINQSGWEDGDIQYILCSLAFLEYLLKNKLIKKNKSNCRKITEMIISQIVELSQQSYRFYSRALSTALDIISNLLDYVQFDEEDIERILNRVRWRYHISDFDAHVIFNLFIKITKKIRVSKKRNLESVWFTQFIEEYVERIIYLMRTGRRVSLDLLEDFLKFADECNFLDSYSGYIRVINMSFTVLEDVIIEYAKKRRVSFDKKCLIIKFLYTMLKCGSRCNEDFIDTVSDFILSMDMNKLYDKDQEIFKELMMLVNDHVLKYDRNIADEIRQLVKKRGEQLTIMDYRQIKTFAKNTYDYVLLEMLESLTL